MDFKQFDDGSCDIIFSDEEINILKNNKKLHLSAESLKHLSNHLMRTLAQWHLKFDKKTKELLSKEDTPIITEKSNR